MEQLTKRAAELESQGRLIELSMLQRKVSITLSREQFSTLGRIISMYVADINLIELHEKAIVYLLFHLYEVKIRRKALNLKASIKLSLDIPQCYALMIMFEDVSFMNLPYEATLGRYIISEIDHQTA